MTGPEGESAIMLFVVFLQLLKLCGAIHNFGHPFTFVLLHALNNFLIAPLALVLIVYSTIL